MRIMNGFETATTAGIICKPKRGPPSQERSWLGGPLFGLHIMPAVVAVSKPFMMRIRCASYHLLQLNVSFYASALWNVCSYFTESCVHRRPCRNTHCVRLW